MNDKTKRHWKIAGWVFLGYVVFGMMAQIIMNPSVLAEFGHWFIGLFVGLWDWMTSNASKNKTLLILIGIGLWAMISIDQRFMMMGRQIEDRFRLMQGEIDDLKRNAK